MVTSPYECKILQWDENPQTNNNNIQCAMKVYDISKYMRYHNVLLEWYHSIIDKQTVYRNNCYDDNCVKTNDKVYFTKLILVQISTFIHFNDVSQAMMRNATDVKIHIYRFEFISRKYIFMLISHNLSITQLW